MFPDSLIYDLARISIEELIPSYIEDEEEAVPVSDAVVSTDGLDPEIPF